MRASYVYIMSSATKTLYVGVTADLQRRVFQHKRGLARGFTQRYRITRLVYSRLFFDIRSAIAWEKDVKGWRRDRKMRLIAAENPEWRDLSLDWGPGWGEVEWAGDEGGEE